MCSVKLTLVSGVWVGEAPLRLFMVSWGLFLYIIQVNIKKIIEFLPLLCLFCFVINCIQSIVYVDILLLADIEDKLNFVTVNFLFIIPIIFISISCEGVEMLSKIERVTLKLKGVQLCECGFSRKNHCCCHGTTFNKWILSVLLYEIF